MIVAEELGPVRFRSDSGIMEAGTKPPIPEVPLKRNIKKRFPLVRI